MKKYHGIVIIKHGFLGSHRQLYTAEMENSYRSDVSAGKVVLPPRNEECSILDSVWLDEPVDYGGALNIAKGMTEKIPAEDLRGILQSYGKAAK